MRKATLLIIAATAALPAAVYAGQGADQVLGQWDPLPARYIIHSRGATYAEPPTKDDRALTVLFEGEAAKEVFDLIGPDARVKCSPEKRDRERSKKGVSCTYTAQLNDPKDFHYRCWIGINLRTGDGDVRISC